MTETWAPSERELERRRVRRARRRSSVLVSTLTTLVVFALLAFAITSTPGWERVRETFFDLGHARDSLPQIWEVFWRNVLIFLVAEPFILLIGLLVALVRVSRSALLTPLRIVAVLWTDMLRGVPTVLLILLFGFGVPALRLEGLPTSGLFWAAVALVLSYSAYVAEVFRAGIDSIHPSQLNSASALGLSRGQALRFVVVPQAVRRVAPPLLNDFVSLQKDTALVSLVGAYDAVAAAREYTAYNFNYTAYVVVALFFVVLTVPLARFTDWLQRRWVEKERAGAL